MSDSSALATLLETANSGNNNNSSMSSNSSSMSAPAPVSREEAEEEDDDEEEEDVEVLVEDPVAGQITVRKRVEKTKWTYLEVSTPVTKPTTYIYN